MSQDDSVGTSKANQSRRRPRSQASSPPATSPDDSSQAPLTVTHAHVSISPLPDPLELARYEQVLPGLTDRIVIQFEAQGTHRRDLERKKIESDLRIRYVSMLCGLTLAIAIIGAGTFIVATGHPA